MDDTVVCVSGFLVGRRPPIYFAMDVCRFRILTVVTFCLVYAGVLRLGISPAFYLVVATVTRAAPGRSGASADIAAVSGRHD